MTVIFTPNTIIKSADVNLNFDAVSDIGNWSNPYKFKVTASGTVTITSGAYTQIPFNTEVYDTNSNFNTTNYDYTIPINGYYMFELSIGATAGGTAGRSGALIYVDDVQTYWGPLVYTASGVTWVRNCIVYDCFTAGQVIEGRGFVDGSNSTSTNDVTRTRFSGFLVSAL